MEGEEDPWAGMGMDDAEEARLGTSANAESRERAHAEQATDPEHEWNKLHEDWRDEADPWAGAGS